MELTALVGKSEKGLEINLYGSDLQVDKLKEENPLDSFIFNGEEDWRQLVIDDTEFDLNVFYDDKDELKMILYPVVNNQPDTQSESSGYELDIKKSNK